MYDGDAMVHCIRIQDGKATAYSNTWLRSPRFVANESAGKELYVTFGDLTQGGLPVARKMGLQGAKMKSGAIPTLKG
jgi:carotenoid cleavage dioxygenase-like enzyme